MGISKHRFHNSRNHNLTACRQIRLPALSKSVRQSNGPCKDNEHHHLTYRLTEDVLHHRTTCLCHSMAKRIITLRNKVDKVALVATSYSQSILVNSHRLNDPHTWITNL